MRERLRVVTFNLNGAFHGGRSTSEQQARGWHHLAALDADIALVQEAAATAIPAWVGERWDIVAGDVGVSGKVGGWGSVIAARPELNLRARVDLLDDPWLALLYDYLVLGEIDLPDGSPALVASVHAVAATARDFLGGDHQSRAMASSDLERIAQPGDEAWVLDIAFEALHRNCDGTRFLTGGDWNTSRLFDALGRDGKITNTLFFSRAAKAGWWECAADTNDERSFLRPGTRPHQLDHLFCDRATGAHMTGCSVQHHPVVDEITDHAPLVADFAFGLSTAAVAKPG